MIIFTKEGALTEALKMAIKIDVITKTGFGVDRDEGFQSSRTMVGGRGRF